MAAVRRNAKLSQHTTAAACRRCVAPTDSLDTLSSLSAKADVPLPTGYDSTTTTPPLCPPPPSPGSIIYGTLTPTSSSLPFALIRLQRRVTTFGRHEVCNSVWPDRLDTRVPKFAFDIAFWYPRLERSLAKRPNLKWHNEGNLRTIIATRTTSAILVNGVALTKKPDAEEGLRYGVLQTGDTVMVFNDKRKKGKGERLEFRVDIKIGKSVAKRNRRSFKVVEWEGQAAGDAKNHLRKITSTGLEFHATLTPT
ncbi:MAG: hypothetical protein L6R38_002330 [Xanthoria sp. 2 TBL-2021]|nr:MAG: hypothetical protein L6R38_002330 [Xanthoria sp. 2 TBL-2021]